MSKDFPSTTDVAIVGMGPRGLSVLERLLVRSATLPAGHRLRIWTVDPGEHGAGRIWRTTQQPWFMMNTAAGEVSLYSGPPDDGDARPGYGPSLAEWLRDSPDPELSSIGPNDYASRAVYGRYLSSVFDALVAHADDDRATVVPVHDTAVAVERDGTGATVVCAGGRRLPVDRVVLCTGHPTNVAGSGEASLVAFAEQRPDVHYFQGDSAADLPLDTVRPGEQVGIVGLGLTFFDVLMDLTLGRGGRFDGGEGGDGELTYHPSGREPVIAAGSRSGVVMLARGVNQKPPAYRYTPVFVTEDAVIAARRASQRRTGSAQLDFVRDVLPLLEREVAHVYYSGQVRLRHGRSAASAYRREDAALGAKAAQRARQDLLARFGVADIPPVDLHRLARPFEGEQFDSVEAFHRRLLAHLEDDLDEASNGNVDGPLKAALDILRDTRGSVRAAVDFAGLRPASQRDDFLAWFNPVNSMLCSGPPAARVAQACALVRSGVLTVVGPDLQVATDTASDCFALESARVRGSRRLVRTLIDARIPRPHLDHDSRPLVRQLVSHGLISEHVNTDPLTGAVFASGAVAVTRPPFHVLDRRGLPDPCVYAIGIPTENNRWFTQIGNGRPGPLSGFHADADSIAVDVVSRELRANRPGRAPQPSAPQHRAA